MGSAGLAPSPAAANLAQAQPIAARSKRTAQPVRKVFVFTTAGAAAARAARPQVEAPWTPLAQRATLWQSPAVSPAQRAAPQASLRLASRA
jgi:hypothetical protein